MTPAEGDGLHAALVKIQGGVDLINERLIHSNQINDERHAAIKADISDIRETQQRHSNRIGVLETESNVSKGERKGVALGGRILWAAIGFVPGAIVAALKLMGL